MALIKLHTPCSFHIEDRPCTLEFRDALQTVLLNGRPFNVEFGGLPQPILIGEKKHFVRFSVLPCGFRAGYVKIAGMKGEQPKEDCTTNDTVADQNQSDITLSSTANVSSPVESDATSQDDLDHSYTSKSGLFLSVIVSMFSKTTSSNNQTHLSRFTTERVVFGCIFSDGTLFRTIISS